VVVARALGADSEPICLGAFAVVVTACHRKRDARSQDHRSHNVAPVLDIVFETGIVSR
jgi:hypothetical protein